jgi:hypothetical protein
MTSASQFYKPEEFFARAYENGYTSLDYSHRINPADPTPFQLQIAKIYGIALFIIDVAIEGTAVLALSPYLPFAAAWLLGSGVLAALVLGIFEEENPLPIAPLLGSFAFLTPKGKFLLTTEFLFKRVVATAFIYAICIYIPLTTKIVGTYFALSTGYSFTYIGTRFAKGLKEKN